MSTFMLSSMLQLEVTADSLEEAHRKYFDNFGEGKIAKGVVVVESEIVESDELF